MSCRKTPSLIVAVTLLMLFAVDLYPVNISIDPEIKYQQFEGWGTSLCWWAVLAGKWSENRRNELIGAIVDPDTGLGYNCFRYNIGGGDQPGHTHLAEARAVPGFKASENAPYDWTADVNQRNILLGIADRGKDLIFEAFSNSPPWWMTISGCASGNTNGADNLKPEYFSAFADYLTTVVKQYKEQWGITFRTVEPFNEPSSGYWKKDGGQEGCGFKSGQSRMVKELGEQLKSKELFPQTTVSAADETSLEQTFNTFKSYDDSAFSFVSQINSHSYGGWRFRSAVDSLAKAHDKNLWQSESGPLEKSDNSDIAMWMSHLIIQDLRVMKANAWLDWQVCDPVGDWITIELNHSTQTFKYTKRYYMHAAFSRFIRPGSQIIHSSDTNSVAAIDKDSKNLIVIQRNERPNSNVYIFDLSKFNLSDSAPSVFRFTTNGGLQRVEDFEIGDKQISYIAPGMSITTCVIPILENPVNSPAPAEKAGRPSLTWSGSLLRFTLRSGAPYKLSIYDAMGKRIRTQRMTGFHENSIDMRDIGLAAGTYVAELVQGGTQMKTRFIITDQ
ncbi:MAG: T9SS type A sorting domain-containing protein [Fibrobacter sp.]|nr:T9SS type A sorting domain-containing protein [Fibrobacter sp.]